MFTGGRGGASIARGLAGAYLRLRGDFNAAVRACARTFGSPARLLNVTNGENAFLVALKRDGRLLADEADIVAPQDAVAITDLFLLREPLTPRLRAELPGLPAQRLRRALASHRATISLSPAARDALRHADLIVYGPGTPHSSLLPSYLTPGVAEAIAASRARAKVFVVNIRQDHDVRGLSAPDLVDHALAYLAGASRGTATGEVNFLPFLPYLSQVHGWPVTVVGTVDPAEARGINTPDDLEYARRAYRRCAD